MHNLLGVQFPLKRNSKDIDILSSSHELILIFRD